MQFAPGRLPLAAIFTPLSAFSGLRDADIRPSRGGAYHGFRHCAKGKAQIRHAVYRLSGRVDAISVALKNDAEARWSIISHQL
jgi:hypothetical protein